MENKRLKLHNLLIKMLGNENVYYQTPNNLVMKFPCIKYSKDNIDHKHADNINYLNTDRYILTVIDKKPDNKVINKLLELPMSSYDRHYVSDNMNHDVVIIYY